MSSLKNEAIQGNLSTSRDITAGGHLNVHGNSVFDHNVVIKGWLDAKNIKGPCKGLYASLDALKEAYPRPMPGWYALVGNTLPADVYRSDGGEWVATGEQGGEVNLYLDQLEEDVANLDDDVKDIQEFIADGVLLGSSVTFNTTANTVTLTFKMKKPDGTEAPFTVNVPIVTRQTAGMMTATDKQTLINLDATVWPVTVTMSASPDIVEVGVSTKVTLTWEIERRGAEVSDESEVTLNGEEKHSTMEEITINENSPKTLSYTLTAVYDNVTGSATKQIHVVYPTYFGSVQADWTPTETSVKSLTKLLQTSRASTQTGISTSNGKIAYCYPASFGKLISIKDGNGYEVIDSYTLWTVNVGGVNYNCYLLTTPVTSSGVTQIYK